MSYDNFSRVYDALTFDVDYKKRTEYILSLFEKYDKSPSLLLDLACGTGGFSLEFAKKNISVIGVDRSVGMLSRAREKAEKTGDEIMFLNQSAEELDLYGTVDGAVCMLDSLNHIVSFKNLQNALNKVSLFLEKDRLFIFDVNSVFKHQNILSGNCFIKENETVFCAWQNGECDAENKVRINLDFFLENENGEYERFSEEFFERAYSELQLKRALKKAGLRVEAILSDMKKTNAEKTDERIIFVTRKVK